MDNSYDTLEKTAAHQRARLGDTIAQLTQVLDPQRITNQALGTSSELAQSVTAVAVDAARRNPVGIALVAMGAAAFLMNSGGRQGASIQNVEFRGGQDERIANADAKIKAKSQIETGRFSHPGASAADMRGWLDAGLDHLGPDARERVMNVRLKAVDAQETIERHAAKTVSAARQAHQSQPFSTVLAVAGIGALIGALLPSTRAEGNLMGAKRDQLLRQAEAALRSEAETLHSKGVGAVKSGVRAAQEALTDNDAG